MPLYEYVCKDCQISFDALRSMSAADEPIACAVCHSANTTREISLFAAHSVGASGATQTIAGGASGCSACSTPSACSTCGIA